MQLNWLDTEQYKKEVEIAITILPALSHLVGIIKRYPSLVQPVDEQSYNSWLKILDFSSDLRSTVAPGGPIRDYVREFIPVWAHLGGALGYFNKLKEYSLRNKCSFARCSGCFASDMEQLVCGKCLSSPYCSDWCRKV